MKIGSLNVRTLAHAGCLQTLKLDLAKYDLDILGIQETRLDEQEIDLGTQKLFLTNSLRSSNRSKQAGVGIVVKKTLLGCIIENVTVNERLCYIKFAVQQRTNLIVIVCYAPTNEADIQTKEDFWNTITSLTNGFRERERKCLIGGFNAEPGINKENEHLCIGPFGFGEENDNTEKLLSLCEANKLLIGGTLFSHRLVHRYTFNPPAKNCRKKMLDHVLLSSRYRSCLQDVRTRRGKLTLTDHELLTAQLDLKLQNSQLRKPAKIDPRKLHDEMVRTEFNKLVKRKLHENDDIDDVEQSCLIFRNALNEAASKVLVQDRKEHKPSISK